MVVWQQERRKDVINRSLSVSYMVASHVVEIYSLAPSVFRLGFITSRFASHAVALRD